MKKIAIIVLLLVGYASQAQLAFHVDEILLLLNSPKKYTVSHLNVHRFGFNKNVGNYEQYGRPNPTDYKVLVSYQNNNLNSFTFQSMPDDLRLLQKELAENNFTLERHELKKAGFYYEYRWGSSFIKCIVEFDETKDYMNITIK